ncbi:PH domain-containing protein [Qipengyuania aquimaris]|uniref:PH domain-containing protein n=1 Tax=Qipengyuania aquimaris TaxID=255984 RepID=UPI001FD3A033|nr:PH domain-containing protein [Qipengyuania aquimaris]UOR16244.1 PH domain-containing protein [Qipengyuania aquimaris]
MDETQDASPKDAVPIENPGPTTVADGSPDDLTQLDPRYKTMMRLVAGLFAIVLLVGATIAELAIPGWTGVVWAPVLLVVAYIVFYLPMRRYATRGYSLAEERLRVVRGVLFHSDTIVPFGRVQHIDVDQGPLERGFGLATLTVHTAGSHNASVSLPGLAHETALAMREDIRAAIRRDTR